MDFFGAPSDGTNMLPKVVFDKTVFVKLKLEITSNKILMKQTQNNQRSKGKSIPAYGYKKPTQKIREPKVLRVLPNLCDFQ
jgi:hypothetical protein